MNISVQKLLSKIEEELNHAKNAGKDERLREKIYSIKILCELILDEKQDQPAAARPAAPQPAPGPAWRQPVVQQQVFQQAPSISQHKKMDLGDEANGDSLLDF